MVQGGDPTGTGGLGYYIRDEFLDDRHAVFGKVVEGMETVNAIESVTRSAIPNPAID